jgi:site-specific recombinase XerD
VRSGKGGKDRLTYLGQGVSTALEEWLLERSQVEVKPHEPLFCPINKAGKLQSDKNLTDHAVLWILQKRAKEAGVATFSPHDLRRTFISDLLEAGADIATVQKLAGHASVTTTTRYDRRGETTKRKAAGLLHLPYRPRSKT